MAMVVLQQPAETLAYFDVADLAYSVAANQLVAQALMRTLFMIMIH